MSLDKRNLNIDLLKVMSCIAVPVFFMCSGYFMLKKRGGVFI